MSYCTYSSGRRRQLILCLSFILTATLLSSVPFSVSAAAQEDVCLTNNDSEDEWSSDIGESDDGWSSDSGDSEDEEICDSGHTGASCAKSQQKEAADYNCGLYMAESSIPNSGWGLFAGAKGYQEEEAFPGDVAILVTEMPDDRQVINHWKLWSYVWDPYKKTSNFEAHWTYRASLVLPSLGSIANSHTRLYNVYPWEHSVDRSSILRSNSSAGAFSQYQGHQFRASHDIEPGHEVFTKYGDNWFAHRYPDVPRFTDYEAVDVLLSSWKNFVLQNGEDHSLSSDFAGRLWQDLVTTSKHVNDRVQAIMPRNHAEAVAGALHPDGLAGATSTHFRSLEWLEQNGMCVDYLQLRRSEHVPYQNGAFVKRPFQKGERVAPFPVVPISREHLQIKQRVGQQHAQQLLLNYCYGHPESSLLLYPYGHVVNLINHAGGQNKQANVALRWSPLNNSTHWQQSVLEILTQNKTTIMFELYALRGLEAGEEVLLDYGTPYELAWQRHQHEWQLSPPIHSKDYQSPHDFVVPREQSTEEDEIEHVYTPTHMQPRCFIDLDATKVLGTDTEGWYPFVNPVAWWHPHLDPSEVDIAWTDPCDILSVSSIDPETGLSQTYRVVVHEYDYDNEIEEEVPIRDVPWNAIAFVDKPYQGHQFLRQAFRHEIHLSDELFPEAWKDLAVVPPKCKLYMAESTIPNSTVMGVYTAQPMAAGDRIQFGDVVVPVVDYQQNKQLCREYHQIKNETNDRSWSYYHRLRQVGLEANDVLSIIPGLGMLGNSYLHAGAVANAEVVEPVQLTTLHRAHDAGAGASSYYHDAHGIATKFLQAGEELVFENVCISGEHNAAETALTETRRRPRCVKWLEANGRCLDNIRPGDSTILQAGKGAFATRRIAKGTVIAPVPVVPILNRDLELFESVETEHGTKEIRYIGMQLLINYCYGHPSSSLLLFPYSPVVNYVNHNTTPNAKLQWSTLPSHQRDWLNRSPADLAGQPNAGIILELVALGDIQPNEEVFIDYGDDWMESWREFEVAWHPPKDEESYVPAWLLNKRMEWIRTETERETDPYPYDTVFTACSVGRERSLVDGKSEPPIYQWTSNDGNGKGKEYFLPCDILERDIGDADLTEVMDRRESIAPLEVHYKVRLHHEGESNASIYLSVPREAIRFFDTKYTSDLFLRNAFRHEIHLPDDLLPKAWRDLELVQEYPL